MPLSSIQQIRYEFDPTGTSPNNLVSGELHQTTDQKVKIIVPKHSAFYADSLVIRDAATGQVVPETGYYLDDPSEIVASTTGKAAYHTILITQSGLGRQFSIDYQSVGGVYSVDKIDAIYNRLQSINTDKRGADWAFIKGKPKEFNPAEHIHNADQLHGFGRLVYILERFITAHNTGDEASHDAMWDELKKIRKELEDARRSLGSSIDNQISPHISRTDNPHRVTAEQVGSYTRAQIDEKDKAIKTLLDAFINRRDNPNRVTAAQVNAFTRSETTTAITQAESRVNGKLDAHKNDRNNPHGVTAEQVGTLTVSQINSLVNGVKSTLNQHANNKNNPHEVTAAQVGAFTKQETTNAISQAEGRLSTALNSHKTDYSNPHKVTAAQVGTLTTEQINNLVNGVKTTLNGHIAKRDNPHGVTAAQVGAPTIQAMTNAIEAMERKILQHVESQILTKYFSAGKLKPTALPLSTTRGNELKISGDGLFYQFLDSDFVNTNGYVVPHTHEGIRGVKWTNKQGNVSYVLYPAVFQ